MANKPQINYFNRDFQAIRNDLINWAKAYHPDILTYFNDANNDVMYLEMCAYVGDMLGYYLDKSFNENFRTSAQARASLVRIANDLGLFELGITPAQTQIVLSIQVPKVTPTPPDGVNRPNPDLLFVIKPELKLKAASGEYFEILEEVNFADERNRVVIPNLDSNNELQDYTIKKYLPAKAGQTKVQRFYVTEGLAQPFLQITINDTNVSEIVGIVNVPGNQFTAPATEDFYDSTLAWHEVRDLVQSQLFLEVNPSETTTSSIKTGEMVDVSKRFIVRRDENDQVIITFGNNVSSYKLFNEAIQSPLEGGLALSQVLNNTELGEIPAPNSTLFIKYRAGGGANSNAQVGQITSITNKQFYPPASTVNFSELQAVRNSLTATNEIPAVGGKDIPTIEEIRAMSGKTFAAQDRGVSYPDIRALIDQMPAKFGRPFRISCEEIKPNIASFNEVQTYINNSLTTLLDRTTQSERETIVQQINGYLTNYTGKASTTAGILSSSPTLWMGEKCRIYLVSKDENGQLVTLYKNSDGFWVSPQDTLKQNIANYLINKRVMGDWIDIVDGKVIDVRVEFTVLTDKNRKQEVLIQCLQALRSYFDPTNWEFNQPIFTSNVITTLQQINGVINVTDIKFYNIFGLGTESKDPNSNLVYQPVEIGRYRNNKTTSVSNTNNVFEMVADNNLILGYADTIFEVKWPEHDIVGKAI